MENCYEFASGRRSIRKYRDTEIPEADIEYFIRSAVTAPSGCNSQNWKFVAVRDREIIEKMALAVESATKTEYGIRSDEESMKFLEAKGRGAAFFRKAPLVIAVFMTNLVYYDPRIVEICEEKGYTHCKMMDRMSYPDVLSVGAAIENMLLAIH